MNINPRLILNFQTYNSTENLENLFNIFSKSNLNISKIYVTDNNSSFSHNEKILLLKKLKSKYFDNTIFILNKKNYGIGGSQKIIYKNLKDEKFDYFVNLQTTNRYDPKKVLIDIEKNIVSNKQFYLFSRFMKKESTDHYSPLRKFANHFFIFLTKFLTNTNFTDPGNAQYILKKELFDQIEFDEIKDITNSSHYPHFFNIKIYNKKIDYLEIPIDWGEGNIKSHLNPAKYPIVLFFSLLKYFFTKSFFLEKNNYFEYDKIS
jgi:hypothetical protein